MQLSDLIIELVVSLAAQGDRKVVASVPESDGNRDIYDSVEVDPEPDCLVLRIDV